MVTTRHCPQGPLDSQRHDRAVVATPSVSFTYDPNYNRILTMVDGLGTNTYSYYTVTNGQLGAGKLASVTNSFADSVITYDYDALGRVSNRDINGAAQQLTYDDLGRVTIMTNVLGSFTNDYVGATALVATNFYPDGQQAVFSYYSVTNDERLQQIWNKNSSGDTVSKFDYTYDPDGQITTWTKQADANPPTVTSLGYDPADQLLSAVVTTNTTSAALLAQYLYGYDAAGNRLSEVIQSGTNNPATVNASGYNNLNQPTNVSSTGGQVLFAGTLDKAGTVNVAGSAVTTYRQTNFTGYATVSQGTNVVSVTAADSYGNARTNTYQIVVTNNGVAETLTYDLDGNLTNAMTATATNTYQWDAANRLVSITGPTNQSLFSYDGLGRRVQITELQNGVPVSTNRFVWDGQMLAEERDNSGASVIKRFFGQGEQISGTDYYFTRDHLGSVREMTDGSGTIQARYDYDPFGRQTRISGDMDADFGFTGHYVHAASGLYLTLYRAYDPNIGRWLSRDPLAEAAGLNLYAYVLNNTMNRIDRTGQLAIEAIVGGVVGGISGAIGAIAGGGDWKDALVGAASGAAAGFALGLIDPTEGVLSVGLRMGLLGGLAGMLGDAFGQRVDMYRNPCKSFNWWELAGAGLGGAIGDAGGAILTDAAAGIGEWGANIIGGVFGAGPSTFGSPAAAKISGN